MKIRAWILHLGVVLTLLISIVFSWLIWVNPTGFEQIRQRQENKSTTNDNIPEEAKKSLDDIYTPTSLMYTKATGKKVQLINTKYDILQTTKATMNKVRIISIHQQNKAQFDDVINMKQSYILNYSDVVPLKLVKILFKQVPNNYKNFEKFTINQIIFPAGKSNIIYIGNSKTKEIFEVKVKYLNTANIEQIAAKKNTRELAINFEKINDNQYRWTYPEGVKLPQYSYLLTKDTIGNFANKLLGTSTSISTKEKDGDIIYSDGANQRLTLKNKLKNVEYVNYGIKQTLNDKNESDNFNQILRRNLNQLNSLGVSLDDVRYSTYNPKKKEIDYRGYVSGFPIVSAEGYGDYRFTTLNGNGEKINFSLYSLQVPVPNNNRNVELPSTNEVLELFEKMGVQENKIKEIKLAYAWHKNLSNNQVVDLKPTYYVKIGDTWMDYQSGKQENQE